MKRSLTLVLALCLGTCASSAWAQDPPPAKSGLTVASVTSQLAAAQARTDLEDGLRKRAVDAYTNALEVLRQVSELGARAEQASRKAAEAPRELEEIRARLASFRKVPKPDAPEQGSLADLEATLTAARKTVASTREQFERLRREVDQRSERRRTIGEQLSQARQRLAPARAAADAPEPAAEPARAEHVLARARFEVLQVEARTLELELAADEARADVVAGQRDLAQRELSQAEEQAAAWEEHVSQRRRSEAAAQSRRARELLLEAARDTPRLRAAAEEYQRLANRRLGPEGLIARQDATNASLKERQGQLRDLKEGFARLRRRLEAEVPSETMGLLFRRQLEALPQATGLAAERRRLVEGISRTQADQVELEEARAGVSDVEGLLNHLAPASPEERTAFLEVGRKVLEARRDLLNAVLSEHQRLLDSQLELDHSLISLTKASAELRVFAEERILWIPSVTGSLIPERSDFSRAFAWLTDVTGARVEVAAAVREASTPFALGLLLLALSVLPTLALSLRTPRPEEGAGVDADAWISALRRTSPVLCACALALSLAWLLDEAVGAHARAAGAALGLIGLYGGVLALVWGLSPSVGGRNLRWLLLVCGAPFLAASGCVAAMEFAPDLAWTNALGRSVFVIAMGIEALALGWALRSSGPLGAPLRAQGGMVGRLVPVLAVVAASLPLAMAGLALAGYYYTALRLEVRFEGTLVLVMAALLVYDVLVAILTAPARALPPTAGASSEADPLVAALAASPTAAASAAVAESLAGGEVVDPASVETALSGETQPGGAETQPGGAETQPGGAETHPGGAETHPGEAHPAPEGAPAARSPSADPQLTEASALSPPLDARAPDTTAAAPGPLDPTPSERQPAPDEGAPAPGEFDAHPAPVDSLSSLLVGSAPQSKVDHESLRVLANQARDTMRVVVALGLILSLAAVWAEVLPALGRLRDLRLYPTVEVVDTARTTHYPALEGGPSVPAGGAPTAAAGPSPAPANKPGLPGLPGPAPSADGGATPPLVVTAADLGLSLLLFLATLALVRSLPGALEFALIGRLPLDAGARYAASTVARYLVAFVGFTAAAQALGIGWERIQWLAAALTFGLAFGLQEIFANFISGLIILFERPVRVGDIVTLGDVTGKVTRVRMRATTITDWNRKELIIPNKELVTGRVINWTLTESVTRSVIPIGIAYGSDVEVARGLILAAARAEPDVLTDPEPACWFEAFGDSVYDLQLRVWLPQPSLIPKARHHILNRIRGALDEAGIEIAFPQRDLHLRSAEPVIRVRTEKGSK